MEGPRCADEIEHPAPDLADHGVGRGEAPHPGHRLTGDALDERDVRLLEAFLGESRGRGIVAPAAQVHVPPVGQLGQQLDDLASLSVAGDAIWPHQLVDREAHPDTAVGSHRLLGLLDQLAQQAHPVLQAAAVLVCALIVTP